MEKAILLTRTEVLQAFGLAYTTDENAHKVLDSEVAIALVKILFGDKQPKQQEQF